VCDVRLHRILHKEFCVCVFVVGGGDLIQGYGLVWYSEKYGSLNIAGNTCNGE
jgi:hypothetical protein